MLSWFDVFMNPSVTIVVVPRELFSQTRPSLESLYRNTEYPFTLVYVDGNSPAHVARYLRRASVEKGFHLLRTERFLAPNEARNLGAKHVSSKYVVFVDNDLDFEPGWLKHLVACAEETGAWAVAPVYFEGRPSKRIVHLAGGRIEFTDVDGVRMLHVEHLFKGRRYEDVAQDLREGPTGFFEFHCVLLPLEVLKKLGPLDEEYLSQYEHLDFSLVIRQAGGTIYLTPKARVTYTYAYRFLDRFDVAYAATRWSEESNLRSRRRFLEKWRIPETCQSTAKAHSFAEQQRRYLLGRRRSAGRAFKSAVKAVLPARAYAALERAAERTRRV